MVNEKGDSYRKDFHTCKLLYMLHQDIWLIHLIIINCYASTEDKSNDIKEKIYDALERVVNSLPAYCIKMIVGNLNVIVIEKACTYPP